MMLMVKSQTMLYKVVYDDLRQRIRSGELPIGSRIPPENELTRHYKASTSTVRRAVQLLCDEGLLCKRRPLGTFVIGCVRDSQPRAFPGAPPERSCRIAVVVPDIRAMLPEGDHQHWQLYLRRLKGIFAAAAAHNVTVLLHDLGEHCRRDDYDGLIIIRWGDLYNPEPFNTIARQLNARRIPFVVISDYYFEFSARWWLADNVELEFFRAFQFLAENGARRLLYVGPLEWEQNPRLSALKRGARLFGYQYALLGVENPDKPRACRAIADYCAGDVGKLEAFDTIFCSTDLQALGVMQFLLENGVNIPGDVNLMGCDNIAEAETAPVPLTTFEFSGAYAGELALELMLKAIANPGSGGEMVSGRGRILRRDSVKLLTEPQQFQKIANDN